VQAQAFAKEIARSVSQVLDVFRDGDSDRFIARTWRNPREFQYSDILTVSLDTYQGYVPQDLSGHVTSSILQALAELRLVSRRHFSFELFCFRTRTVGESHEVL